MNDGKPRVEIIRREDGWLRLFTPYDEEFVEVLKGSIPYTSRKWNADHGCWEVAPAYADVAEFCMAMYFPPDREYPEEEEPPYDHYADVEF